MDEQTPPRRRIAWSVRTRILASTLAVAALGLAVAGATAYLSQRDRILTGIDDQLKADVAAARSILTGEPAGAEPGGVASAVPVRPGYPTTAAALEAILARIVPDAGESSVGIVAGRARYVPGTTLSYRLDADPAFIARIASEVADDSVRIGTADVAAGLVRYVAVPVRVTGDPQHGIYVSSIDIRARLADLDSAFLTYGVVALAALAMIALVGWFVAGRLLAPVRDLRHAASRITVEQLSERIPVRGRDDISALTGTVNDMLDRLQQSVLAQRQLLDDVRHELKTPLTIVRGHLELVDPDSPDDVAGTRELALDELDRMAELIDSIDLLASLQPAAISPERTSAAELTEELFRKAAVIAGHDWSLVEKAEVDVDVDRGRITQAWLQLVDNAAKYSPEGRPVRIGSTRRDATVEFWVEDEGGGVPAGAEHRIFERFGRAEPGRGIHGSGLGLPIVLAIARAHGGRVSLSSSTAGSRFAIVVPLPGVGTRSGAREAT